MPITIQSNKMDWIGKTSNLAQQHYADYHKICAHNTPGKFSLNAWAAAEFISIAHFVSATPDCNAKKICVFLICFEIPNIFHGYGF